MTAAAEGTPLVVVYLGLKILLILYFLCFLLLHPLQALLDVWPQILQQLHTQNNNNKACHLIVGQVPTRRAEVLVL